MTVKGMNIIKYITISGVTWPRSPANHHVDRSLHLLLTYDIHIGWPYWFVASLKRKCFYFHKFSKSTPHLLTSRLVCDVNIHVYYTCMNMVSCIAWTWYCAWYEHGTVHVMNMISCVVWTWYHHGTMHDVNMVPIHWFWHSINPNACQHTS